jgi:CDP-glycerol glycerophosphotransferase
MKVDKRNPRHWLYLAAFGLQVVAAWLLRAARAPAAGEPVVVLYGHKLSGNLLALHREMQLPGAGVRPVFLTMDPQYHARLRREGVESCLAWSPQCLGLLRRARAVVSDHGLHPLAWLVGRSHLRFFDVWHGIPFKGFDADDFRLQQRYDETWVASPALAAMYVRRFGFEPARVHATGYARTDALVVPREDRDACLARFGLSRWAGKRFVLFAPTWAQDADDRSLFPFGQTQEEFLGALSQACREAGAVLLVRRHLNSGVAAADTPEDVVFLPFAEHPDTEALLGISDLLVCDWSSIAFDYLLLDRPTIFLDVPPPFRKGFSLGPEYRHGKVVAGMDGMLDAVRRYLADPSAYARDVGDRPARVAAEVYGGMADGRAASRCLARLRRHLLP